MSILEELFYGDIIPAEKYIKAGGEYQKLNSQFVNHTEELRSLLTGKEKQLYDKISNMSIQLNGISEKEYFIDGFCIGAKIILEIMNFKSENYL